MSRRPPTQRKTARTLWVRYAATLVFSNVLAAVNISVVLVLLTQDASGESLMTGRNIVAVTVLTVVGAIVGVVAGGFVVLPSLRWYSNGESPTSAQQRSAQVMSGRQTTIHVTIWITASIVLLLLNHDAGPDSLILLLMAMVVGTLNTACIGYLITEQSLRPIIAAATTSVTTLKRRKGVLGRLILTWTLCSALPTLVIAFIVVAQYFGLLIAPDAAVEGPILIIAVLSLTVGLRGMVLVSRSVSDPVGEVSDAMGAVELGRTDVAVQVYDASEIGHLQTGFNSMVTGLAERERIRDLFGRHVGKGVAQRALERESLLSGEICEVGVLFVDLVGSTTLAATHTPDEVADVLNDFFRTVVTAVDEHDGLINKFGGDAALAIFGAPLAIPDPAGAALAAARAMAFVLKATHPTDFGIGVSCGLVFAGNIGAEERYEYTVIGDPVNEASRLTDLAKSSPGRILASERAVKTAAAEERSRWVCTGETTLRGRTEPTILAEPRTPTG